MSPLLKIENLKVHFPADRGVVRAVEEVNLEIERGQAVGLIGESGCGKTLTALSVLRLLPLPGRIVEGKIMFKGKDLLKFPLKAMRQIRGKEIGIVFQEPQASLDPLFGIGYQLSEGMRYHLHLNRNELRKRAVGLLEEVGIPESTRRLKNYPHQFSGGMAQRVMIAQAISCQPELLIADEPTTALDVTIQAQIIRLFLRLRQMYNLAILFISHDLSLVACVAEKIAVMYAGVIVETAPKDGLFGEPLHPYTQGLIASACLKLGERKDRLAVIPGAVPDPLNRPAGCPFHPRCPQASQPCFKQPPPKLQLKDTDHWVSCWNAERWMR